MSDEPKKAPHEWVAQALGIVWPIALLWWLGLKGIASVVGTIAVFVGGWYVINKMID